MGVSGSFLGVSRRRRVVMVPPATRGYSRPGGPDLALVFGVVDQSGHPRRIPAIDVVREALALIARGASPGHLQAPEFRFYGSVVGLELPDDGWGAERAVRELAERGERSDRPIRVEPLLGEVNEPNGQTIEEACSLGVARIHLKLPHGSAADQWRALDAIAKTIDAFK